MIARVAASMAIATRLIAVRGAQSSPMRLPSRLSGTSSRSPLSSLPSRVAAWFLRPFGPPPRKLWVKKEGDARFLGIHSRAEDVDALTREVAQELCLTDRLSTLTLHVAWDELGKELGAALKNDELLDAALASSAAADAAASASRIVIKVAPSLSIATIAIIKYRMIGKKDVVEPLLRTQRIVSEAEFLAFLLGKTLLHKREGARQEVVDAKTGKKKTILLPDEEIGGVINLPAALDAMQQEGTYLALRDPGFLFSDEVSNFKGFRDNIASAFEEESNKGIAINDRLLDAYGSKLEVLNGGKGVVFYNEATGQAFLQCDGLIKNTSFILVNEAKTHLHEEDIQKLCKKTMPNFEIVLASPSKYKSDPADVLEQLAGLTPVYIASCKGFTNKAKEDCSLNGIHLLESNGAGFKCTLHTKVVAAA